MKTKTFRAAMEIKADSGLGEFRAVFSTFDVIDKDGDVTRPGAFKDGTPVRISYWGHRWQDLPVGKGIIHQDDKKAWVDGRFFMDTLAGKETYNTVKNLGDLQEWSYGYEVLEQSEGKFEDEDVRFLIKLEVPEVSPVMLGAGIDTRTESIKGVKAALPAHSTATTDVAWDGPMMDTRCPSARAALRATHAWVNSDGDPDVKSSYKFIHHMVAGDGTPGAANIRGCQTGIGVLNGGRGGTTIPDADRRGVWNHLARHLRDADVEPPELKSVDDQDQTGNGESRNPPPSVYASRITIELMED